MPNDEKYQMILEKAEAIMDAAKELKDMAKEALGEESDVWSGAESLRLHDSEDFPAHLRCEVLRPQGSGFRPQGWARLKPAGLRPQSWDSPES